MRKQRQWGFKNENQRQVLPVKMEAYINTLHLLEQPQKELQLDLKHKEHPEMSEN